MYVQGIVTLSVAVAAVKFDQSAAVGKVERIGSTAEPTLFGTIDDRTNRLEQDVLAAESVNAIPGEWRRSIFSKQTFLQFTTVIALDKYRPW